MAALPAEVYRDPEIVVAAAEEGDVMPAPKREERAATCFTCQHRRPMFGPFPHIRLHPCELGCMPTASEMRCARWWSRSADD